MTKSTRRVAIYTRVSTDGQTTDNQRRELEEAARRHGWDVVDVFTDHGISGAKGRNARPAFNEMMTRVGRREFDLVAAWSVDRLGRSLQDLVGFLSELHAKSIDLYLHQQGIDTTTPAGKAMFQMLGVFAEFERTIIQERIKAGLARAKANGTKLGRRPTPPQRIAAVRDAREDGLSIRKIATKYRMSTRTVQDILKDAA